MVKLRKKYKIMVLEFLSKADASTAFNFNNPEVLNRLREHPLFKNIGIYRTPIKGEITLCIGYDSGLEDRYVERMIIIKRYKNYIRLIPEDNNYNWIIEELINLFIINKEYGIIVK